jgi:ABC-2 type transport system ATP-binding protein
VGTLVEGPASYGHLSGRANLALFDAMGGSAGRRTRRRRIDEVLERVGLGVAGKRRVKGYSLGMRQRLGIAAALLRAPRLLVLDEPTNGLDPQGIREMRDLLLELNADGTTIFLSSHLLAEVEHMCTRVGVLDRGRLVVQDELGLLCAPTGRTVVLTPDPDVALGLLDGRVEKRDGERLVVRADDPVTLNRLLVDNNVRVRELAAERRGLEQVVLDATTKPHEVGAP